MSSLTRTETDLCSCLWCVHSWPLNIRKGVLMKTILVLCVVLTAGCSTFIVRDDDNAALATGKVVARVLVGIPTLGMSEIGIDAAKKDEAIRAQVHACQERGMVPVTSGQGLSGQFVGCFTQDGFERYMAAQASRPGLDPAAAMLMLGIMNQPQAPARAPYKAPSMFPVPPRPLNCLTTTTGNIANTTCN
jgi:hypothetical protein